MTDFLEAKKGEIAARLTELKPLVEEYRRLEAAARALDGLDTASPAAARRPQSSGSGRRGRPKGSGTRGNEALALVAAQPGITITEIATAMGIGQNYLYRVLPSLEKDGLVEKRDGGWYAKAAA